MMNVERAASDARRRLAARQVFCVVGTLAALGACEAVPNLTFLQPDGSVDATLDGGATDALVESTFPADAGCPIAPPTGVTTCCGASPCTGDCEGRCTECEGQCTGSTPMCCIKNAMSMIVCRAVGGHCP